MTERKIIDVDYLARVEGEGSLHVRIEDGRVEDVKLKIFEAPRFFEAFLRGRHFTEVPDITARICGICPIAYQMSSVHAMERISGIRVEGLLRELRRLVYCGEWIESHMLHVLLLHAPDFLGHADFVEMAKEHRRQVEDGLFVKKIGNRIVALFGGREIHPINIRVGGFYKLPEPKEALPLLDEVREAREKTEGLIRWAASFDFPDLERDFEFVALKHPDEYPFNEGPIASSRGLEIDAADFEDHYEEFHAAYTNALQCRTKDGNSYLVGPMARYALNYERLPDRVKELAGEIGLPPVVRNPYRSILVRGLEVLFSLIEAERILVRYAGSEGTGPSGAGSAHDTHTFGRAEPGSAADEADSRQPGVRPFVEVPPRAGTGWGATEAPRGLLYHRYRTDDEGLIEEAQIVPPTSQNQLSIEEDLRELLPGILDDDHEDLVWRCEQTIRNYDPCISCATHFLDVDIRTAKTDERAEP